MTLLRSQTDLLHDQLTSLWDIITKMDQSTLELRDKLEVMSESRASLVLVIEAIQNDIARRDKESANEEVQLELDLNLEPA